MSAIIIATLGTSHSESITHNVFRNTSIFPFNNFYVTSYSHNMHGHNSMLICSLQCTKWQTTVVYQNIPQLVQTPSLSTSPHWCIYSPILSTVCRSCLLVCLLDTCALLDLRAVCQLKIVYSIEQRDLSIKVFPGSPSVK